MKIRSLDNPSVHLSVISDDQGDIYLTVQDTEKDPFGQTVRIGGPASGHQLPNRIHRLLYALASEFKRFEKIRFESDAAQMEDLEKRQLKENSSSSTTLNKTMNREIKFRGKRLDNNEWVYGYMVPVITSGETEYHIVSEIRGGSIQGFAVDPSTVGQYTGMEDKNGNPIWEGDIVRYRITDERFKKNPKYTVKVINYEDNSARFQAGNIYHQDLRSARLTVLGNIFDHSNLYPETIQNQKR